MRRLALATFTLTLLASTAAIAAPDARVAPKATSKYGFAWKDNGKEIGAGAEKSERNSSPYFVYQPKKGVKAKGKLVIFLHGSGGAPAGYTTIMQVAAAQGFHVIGLSYPMSGNIGNLCKTSNADTPECPSKFREEVWSGAAKSPLVDVAVQDSLHNRIFAVIHYLAANPAVAGAGWNAFIAADDKVAWGKVTMAGHSLGSGYAAYVASQKQVERVIMISGPSDGCDTGQCIGNAATDPLAHELVPGSWLAASHATSGKSFFALAHTNDINDDQQKIPRIERTRSAWKLLGLPGPEQTIDGLSLAELKALAPAPHRLLSSTMVWKDAKSSPNDQQDAAHGRVAGSAPEYEAAWIYMLTK